MSSSLDVCMRALAKTIHKRGPLIICVWIALTMFFSPFAFILVTQRMVGLQKSPPTGSDSAIALRMLVENFGTIATARKEMVVLRCKEKCGSAAGKLGAREYMMKVENQIRNFGAQHPGSLLQLTSYYDYTGPRNSLFITNPMMSFDKQSILLTWMWSVPPHLLDAAEAFVVRLREVLDVDISGKEPHDGLEAKLTGHVTLGYEMKWSTFEFPLNEMKAVWMPILVLGCVLQRTRLLLIALLPMGVEIPVAIGIMYFVSLYMEVSYYGLMLVLLLITALSWDYALFTLTRYSAELTAGASHDDAIVTSIEHSGSLIVVSGVVLTICWSTMVGMPDMFQSFAISAATAILTTVSAQVSLVPSILAASATAAPSGNEQFAALAQFDEGDVHLSSSGDECSANEKAIGEGTDAIDRVQMYMHGWSFRLGRHVTKYPFNLLAVVSVYGAMMPLTIRFAASFDLPNFTFTGLGHSFGMTMPRSRDEWQVAGQIQSNFTGSQGVLMPLMIIATKTVEEQEQKSLGMLDPVYLDQNCRLINALIDVTRGKSYALNADSFVSPDIPEAETSTGGVTCKKYWEMRTALMVEHNYLSRQMFLPSASKKLEELWKETVRNNAVLMFIFPEMDPLGPESFALVRDVREVLNARAVADSIHIPGLERKVFGPSTVMMDLTSMTASQLPVCFALCVVICFLLIALWFGAAFIPIKLMVTVIVPITWTYGAALYVYHDGALVWTGIPGLSPSNDRGLPAGLDWTVPVFSLTFLVGLALDYDFFLFERVYDFRVQGFGDREAVQLGLSATGGTISAAGLILGLTFVSLIFESELATLNQLGFVYVFSIAVDTFLVRTIAVPGLLSMSPWLNFWPRVMPPPRFEWLQDGGEPMRQVPHSRDRVSDASDWDEK